MKINGLLLLGAALLFCGCTTKTTFHDEVATKRHPKIEITIASSDTSHDWPPAAPPSGMPYINYPYDALRAGISGLVTARLKVDKNGRVTDVVILDSSHKEFAAAVLTGAKNCVFQPAKHSRQPVDCSIVSKFDFSIEDD